MTDARVFCKLFSNLIPCMFKPFFLSFVLLLSFPLLHAQNVSDANEYLNRISGAQEEMNQKYMAYVSAVAHSHRARKIEHLRTKALESISDAKDKTTDLPNFGDDTALRKAGMDYIEVCYSIFKGDFSKIVDVEDIAEQSVDQMQAYLLLQELAARKLREATSAYDKAQRDFAEKYHVAFPDSRGELLEKIKFAERLSRYCDQVYIIYFKAGYEEQLLFQAMRSQKMIDAEQARASLLDFANDGLKQLSVDSIRDFQGDAQLADGCRGLIGFYKDLAEREMPDLIEFYLKQESFNKMKMALDAKGKNISADEKKDFRRAENEIKLNQGAFIIQLRDVMSKRQVAVQMWNSADKSFRDRETPYYKK